MANFFLLVLQRSTVSDANLLLDDVDAGDGLGHRMLDLQARIHFHEVELVVAIKQEFNRARIHVTHGFGGTDSQLADVIPLRFGKLRRRGDFDQFLIASLNGAVAFVQMNAVAVAVADDLDFNVLRVDDALFNEDFRLAEGLARFRDDALIILDQILVRVAAPDTATAAAVGCLQHDRIADFLRQLARFLDIFQIVV